MTGLEHFLSEPKLWYSALGYLVIMIVPDIDGLTAIFKLATTIVVFATAVFIAVKSFDEARDQLKKKNP